MNARNTSLYNYRNYRSDSSPVTNGAFREFSFSVTAKDTAMNSIQASNVPVVKWVLGMLVCGVVGMFLCGVVACESFLTVFTLLLLF